MTAIAPLQIEQTVTPYHFISYSRTEITFVDSLSRTLKKRGLDTWVDYRNLVLGRSWKEQINEGIDNADTLFIVVSKRSMASKQYATNGNELWTKASVSFSSFLRLAN